MNNRKSWTGLTLTTIAAIVIAAAIGGVIFFAIRNNVRKLMDNKDQTANTEEVQTTEVDLSKYPYVRETDYKNPFKYMDVYAHPFQKSQNLYIMNKEYDVDKEKIAKFTKELLEKIYTTDYKQISASREEYENGFSKYVDMNGIFILEKGPGSSEEIEYPADAVEAIESYYVENMLSTDAEFFTDSSLVYEDGYIFCRGVLELETFSDSGSTKTAIPVDVLLKQDMGTGLFSFCGMVGVDDYDDFDIG